MASVPWLIPAHDRRKLNPLVLGLKLWADVLDPILTVLLSLLGRKAKKDRPIKSQIKKPGCFISPGL